jgi:hypothetical protein
MMSPPFFLLHSMVALIEKCHIHLFSSDWQRPLWESKHINKLICAFHPETSSFFGKSFSCNSYFCFNCFIGILALEVSYMSDRKFNIDYQELFWSDLFIFGWKLNGTIDDKDQHHLLTSIHEVPSSIPEFEGKISVVTKVQEFSRIEFKNCMPSHIHYQDNVTAS